MSTKETLELIKAAQADIQKAGVVQGSGVINGVQGVNLEAPAQLIDKEVETPLRLMIPRVSISQGSSQANWKIYNDFGDDGEAGVSEGARGSVRGSAPIDRFAKFVTLGKEGQVSQEAINATQGYFDVLATETNMTLRTLMQLEEKTIIGGRGTTALAAPAGLAAVAAAGGALAAGNYVAIARALTSKGAERSSLANGVKVPYTEVVPSGDIETRTGYASNSATLAVNGVTLNQKVTLTATPVAGAAGYAWYFGAAGSERLVAITTLATVEVTALNGTSQLHTALPAGDFSVDNKVFDGLLVQSALNGAFNVQLANGTALSGSNGSIDPVDNVLQNMFDANGSRPSVMFVSSDLIPAVTKLINANQALAIPATQGALVGGAFVQSYISQATGAVMKVVNHRALPKGTIFLFSGSHPAANGPLVKMLTRQEYYMVEWARNARRAQFGVYVDEVLQHKFPSTMAVISNIKA